MSDTIAAIATAPGPSAIGVVRLSGPDTCTVLDRVFRPKNGRPMSRQEPRRLVLGDVLDRDGQVIDSALAVLFPGPGSYTGQDCGELQCHGSPVVLDAALAAMLAAGARQAKGGEFTRRAFLNGRMDLLQAEAVADLIDAETAQAAHNAVGQLEGVLSRTVTEIYDGLMAIVSRFYAVVDYPDEDIGDLQREDMLDTLRRAENRLEELLAKLDPSLMSALQELQSQLLNMLWQLVSSLSVVLVGGVSMATSFATSLPGFLIRLLLMVISTFFIAVDYQKIVRFCLGCLQGSTRNLVLQVKAYVVGTLFVCIRSYALIMSITFVELSVGLTLIGVNRAILVALLIAIFDILPVLGTGGIMIPWVILSALGGDLPHAFALLVLYVIITVIRNIIEPRIVGAQIGLHPVLTLMSMFVGNHLFGIVGLFGLPILLSLLRYLNDNGTISLFPASALGRADTETSR